MHEISPSSTIRSGLTRTVAQLDTEVNANKTTRLRRLGDVDVTSIQHTVLALPAEAWDGAEAFRVNYNKTGALRQTAHVIFRFSDRRSTPIRYLECADWRAWRHLLLPILRDAVRPLGYRTGVFPRVMLARLRPGGFIPPHVDGDARGSVPHKIHVPIVSNARVYFFEDDQRTHLGVGSAYEVNNGTRHSVVNGGATDRIHLVFEYLDAACQRFRGPTLPAPDDDVRVMIDTGLQG